jgi:wobble nucleotide-excising tRNase
MLRRIQHIKSFGVFANFQWPPGLPDFKKFNLIYGWNYSGKTTLSRTIRCFEQQQLHVDFPGAEVQLTTEDEVHHVLTAPHTAPVLRVFNSDFVRENLSFDEGSASSVLVLGAENKEKQEALKSKKAELETLTTEKRANENKRDTTRSSIDGELTRYARDLIKNPLSVPNYDRTRFEPKVNTCKTAPDDFLLGDMELEKCLSVYRSTDKKPALTPISASLPSVEELRGKVESLLGRTVTGNKPIARLKEDPEVEKWVKQGQPLHTGKDVCQFCGQALPPDLVAHLAAHFSAEYDNLMSDLDVLGRKVQEAEGETIGLPHKGDFYSEIAPHFVSELQQIEGLIKRRKKSLAALDKAIQEKRTKAFSSMPCPAIDDPTSQIAAAVEAVNKLIGEHNDRTAEFDRKRQDAFDKLEKHYAALFVRDQKYNEKLQEIAELNTIIAGQQSKLAQLGTDIRALEQELSEAAKGAERINELLAAYFGKEDLRVVVSADKRFQIHRGGVIAKNLSEGEKTAIAFAHFITRVQDGRTPLADTIVVIDDPISSLDANHLFNTYALIKTQLASCRQLIVSTHSFEFYNLVREWVFDEENTKKPINEWKTWGVYLVKRTDAGNSTLEVIPKELLQFKSEYHYLFSKLYHFDRSDGAGFDDLLSLPNVVRRFMEAFGGIMIPLSTGLKGKMERLFPDPVQRERVWKFINYYSHNTTLTRSLTIPDISECKVVVTACLKAVKVWDADYFADLEKEVSV